MSNFEQRTLPRLKSVVLALPLLFTLSLACLGQDRSSEEGDMRGSRAEISITLRSDSGRTLSTPATVKLYHLGVLSGQAATSNGRAFFILNKMGDYVITAEAAGYRNVQKDVSVRVAINDEEDIVLHKDSGSEDDSATSVTPVLAPKAKESFEKGLQALNQGKVDLAQKYLTEAIRLAPSHPDLLYFQGVLYLKKRQWGKAQDVLEKATQLDPRQARAFAALGMALVNAGRFEQAIPPLRQSLQLHPAGWEAHWALANAYYHQARYEDALAESQKALAESHGAEPEIELLLAQSLTAVGRYEDSAQTLREFLKNHPDAAGAPTARRWLQRLAADGKIRSD